LELGQASDDTFEQVWFEPWNYLDAIHAASNSRSASVMPVAFPGGIVRVRTTGFKQDGLVVIEFLRTFMVYKRGLVPATARTRIPEPKK